MSEYPTGYAQTALPFYQKLDDGEFEQYCTDLLNFHPVIPCLRNGQVVERRIVSAARLLSGRKPQRGADIRADAQGGEVWIFQCKHVQSFDLAQVAEVIKEAEEGWPHADQYVLVTTCGLNAEAVSLIKEKSKWMWWDSSRLTTETQNLQPAGNGINLLTRYQLQFGKEWVKRLFGWGDQAFLTWQEFFAEDLSPDRQHFHHRTLFLSMGDAQRRLETFVLQGAGRALILSAGGGQGKSRLLLELARQAELQQQPTQVRFLNLGRSGLTEEQADRIRQEDLVLVVDDAHRMDAVLEDVARAASKAKSLRLVVATRPQALEAVKSQLFRHYYAEHMEEPLCLPSWTPENMHQLAEQVLDPVRRLHAERLAKLADLCPLLVVLGGALINAGRLPEDVTNEADFRERVFKSFQEDFLRLQPENKRDRLSWLMRFLSFVSPAHKDELLLDKAADILGCTALDVAEDLELLKAARLLFENREGVRLYPDLFADAVLLDACLDSGGRPSQLYRTILPKLQSSAFPSLMRNLAQADWEARVRKGAKDSLFGPVWREFVSRFREATWVVRDFAGFRDRLIEPYTKGGSEQRRPDRAELLRDWTSFAIFLPEKTLELAQLAIKSVDEASRQATASEESRTDAWASVCGVLPPMLKPIVIWHPGFAHQALDLLWSLDAEELKGDWRSSSNAISVIAQAASFEVHKPIAVTSMVLDWLDQKIQEPPTIERIRSQPWILSALLKPFFGREVEHSWSTGQTIHLSSLFVPPEETRPARRKALAVAERFALSPDPLLAKAVVPVLKEAILPVRGRFGSEPSKELIMDWRPDRLEVVKLVEKAAQAHQHTPAVLLQLRQMLRNRCQYDPDEAVKAACERVQSRMPNSLELRVMRALSSFAQAETSVEPGPNFKADLAKAEEEWSEFHRSVARELVEQSKTASELCSFIRDQVRELSAIKSAVFGGGLLESVVRLSPAWCSDLLKELLRAEDEVLDGFLWPVIHCAASQAPDDYQGVLQSLPAHSRSEQLCILVSYLGWKQLHGGGLTQPERRCVMESTKRTEEPVVCSLASAAGRSFVNEPGWAIEVLCRLKPSGALIGGRIVEALGLLVEKHAGTLDPNMVKRCLENLGEFCFSKAIPGADNLETVARYFPKQVYGHLLTLRERAEADEAMSCDWGFSDTFPLGPIGDTEYLDTEVHRLWQKAVSARKASFGQMFCLSLIRSLIWSDAATAPDRLLGLAAACKTGDEIELIARLAAVRGSRIVFDLPDVIRLLLARAADLDVTQAVRDTLRQSVPVDGSYTDHEKDPEFRYVLERSDALANRYRDDPHLGVFYRMIAESEQHHAEWVRSAFAEEEFD